MADPISPAQKFAEDFDNFFKAIGGQLSEWKGNFVRNSKGSVSGMTSHGWIRLLVIVCAYLLIRPWLVKLGIRAQAKQMEKAAKAAEEGPDTNLNANDLRGKSTAAKIHIPGVETDSEDEGEGENGKQGQWGRKARLRQRKIVKHAMKKKMEEMEKDHTWDMPSDEDIADLLT